MAEILTGKTPLFPFGDDAYHHLAKWIRERAMPEISSIFDGKDLDPKLPPHSWPEDSYREFAQIMRKCLEENPANRSNDVAQKLRKLLDGNHKVCVICMASPPNAKLQCKHAVVCVHCAQTIRNRGMGCPICRAPIHDIEIGRFSKTYIP